MIKQLILFCLMMQKICAMEFSSLISEQPSQKVQQEALEKYKQNRESFFCDFYFFNKDDSEHKKESYYEIFKSLFNAEKKEACIGAGICLSGTVTTCSATPFVCDQNFCCEHPLGWFCCVLLQTGSIWGLTTIADKICNDCLRYCNEKRRMRRLEAIEQLRPLSVKVEKVE